MSKVKDLAREFIESQELVDREAFVSALREAMLSKRFALVLGGKNVGKTLIRSHTVCEVENEPKASVTIADVNMRDYPSTNLYTAIFERIVQKDKNWVNKFVDKLASTFVGLAGAIAGAEIVALGAAAPVSSTLASLVEKIGNERTLTEIISELENDTCVLIDEADMALGSGDQEFTRQALAYFLTLTKEKSMASVVLFSSDPGYPYRLQACGMRLEDIQMIIIAHEVPKEEMLKLMKRWKMSEELAELFFSYFGGNIDLCCRGVEQLQEKKDNFDQFGPLSLLDCPGLPTCAADPDAKEHLKNLMRQGWSPVYDMEADTGAKLIAKKNVGGIIPRRATVFEAPEGIWKGNHQYALVPSGTLMRWMIAEELERVGSMGARILDALVVGKMTLLRNEKPDSSMQTDLSLGHLSLYLLYALKGTGCTMSTPPSVWVRQLRKDCNLGDCCDEPFPASVSLQSGRNACLRKLDVLRPKAELCFVHVGV